MKGPLDKGNEDPGNEVLLNCFGQASKLNVFCGMQMRGSIAIISIVQPLVVAVICLF